ncbi:MAG: hypothetical protein ACTSYD_06110 [Candidatus Heimdallarchaeaceae archaeon]
MKPREISTLKVIPSKLNKKLDIDKPLRYEIDSILQHIKTSEISDSVKKKIRNTILKELSTIK